MKYQRETKKIVMKRTALNQAATWSTKPSLIAMLGSTVGPRSPFHRARRATDSWRHSLTSAIRVLRIEGVPVRIARAARAARAASAASRLVSSQCNLFSNERLKNIPIDANCLVRKVRRNSLGRPFKSTKLRVPFLS